MWAWLKAGLDHLSMFWIVGCVDFRLELTERRWVVDIRVIVLRDETLALLELLIIALNKNTIGDDVPFFVSLFHVT